MNPVDSMQLIPRHIRPAPSPLGLYLHVGRNDHRELLDLLARGDAHFFGMVFDATAVKRHQELRDRALSARLDTILDPRTQAAATIGGYGAGIASLPWGLDRPNCLEDFKDAAGRRRIAAMGDFVIGHGFTQMLAPTHLINGSADPWFAVDCDSTRRLREHLDLKGANQIQLLYKLAIPYAVLRDENEVELLIHGLSEVPADAIWLHVEGLGSGSTANGVKNYIRGAKLFESLGKPVIADGTGGLAGLSLLAFGATGGIAHGVTFGERVDHSSWRRPRDHRPFGRSRRVYVPEVDLLMEPGDAESLLRSSSRARALLGCHDTRCCPRGIQDMIESPARHFLIQRMKQLSLLSRLHQPIRAARFVDDMVRPASDLLVQVAGWQLKNEPLIETVRKQRRRLDAMRTALAAEVSNMRHGVTSLPKTRVAREIRLHL